MIRWIGRASFISFGTLLVLAPAGQSADPPLVHPIFAHLPDAPEDATARQAFNAAAGRYQLHPVEVVDVPAPPPSRAPDALHLGILHARELAFGDALRELDAAMVEVAATGGAGLTTAELGDLYLFRAMATAHADWKAEAAAPPTDERTRAYADYLRAATMSPERKLGPGDLPPQVVADFQRAADEIQHRSRGTLVVKGSADAQVALDGGPLMLVKGGVTVHDLAFGEHLVHVEELGYAPWGTTLPFGQPSLEIEIPARPPVALDDATAAAHARRMGAHFALVAQPKGGPGTPVELRLVDAVTGSLRDAALIGGTPEGGQPEGGQIDAAVMRLDEEARRISLEEQSAAPLGGAPASAAPPPPAAARELGPALLLSQPPAKATLGDDPAGWARDHWPLLTAIGVVALTAVVLGATVSGDR